MPSDQNDSVKFVSFGGTPSWSATETNTHQELGVYESIDDFVDGREEGEYELVFSNDDQHIVIQISVTFPSI